MQRA
jgi:hypothetical protein